jgi:hypothetical protein
MKDWNSRNIPMMDAQLHAEARAHEDQLAQQRAAVEQDMRQSSPRRAERGGRRGWWRRLMHLRTLFLVVLAVELAACALHVPSGHSPAGR